MKLFGYSTKKEKYYIVKVKGLTSENRYFKYNSDTKRWYFGSPDDFSTYRVKHTKEELEKAGFGWVFSCPGIEVEEVEE